MTTRPIHYRGVTYQVPTSTRNDAYCKARDRGLSHEAACRAHTHNWMAGSRGLHPLANAKRNAMK